IATLPRLRVGLVKMPANPLCWHANGRHGAAEAKNAAAEAVANERETDGLRLRRQVRARVAVPGVLRALRHAGTSPAMGGAARAGKADGGASRAAGRFPAGDESDLPGRGLVRRLCESMPDLRPLRGCGPH